MARHGSPPSYSLHELTRDFPGVRAVDGVSLCVQQGEIHGVIGRNGAGKSVLMGMLAGIISPSSGSVQVGAARMDARNASPIVARRMGISLIPQEPQFARPLSVLDNLFMGTALTDRLGRLRHAAMAEQVRQLCDRLRIDASPHTRMGALPIETQQMLAFGKAVHIDRARVVLLDEITASLTQARKQMLLQVLRETARTQADISFTLISHHISEIMEFTDRVTVMRDGRAVATLETATTVADTLAHWIVGDTPAVAIEHRTAAPAKDPNTASPAPALELRGLACADALAPLDLRVEVGEVVGLAGLEGSGKDTVMELLFGLRRPSGGTVHLRGEAVHLASPRQALRLGLALLPKHREAQAIIHRRSVMDNMLISSHRLLECMGGFLSRRRSRALATQACQDLLVKTPGIDTPIDHLSGGNKQKVLINRLALTRPLVFLLNEPTRGVDISAKPPLLKVVRERLAEHSAVLMISESEEELTAICDRVLVFFQGRVCADLRRGSPAFNVGEIYRQLQGVSEA